MQRRTAASNPKEAPADMATDPPAAATVSGDGVSPAATAARKGLPTGSAAATSDAEDGRSSAFGARQQLMMRSITGSKPLMMLDSRTGDGRFWSKVLENGNAWCPLNNSYMTRPAA